MDYFFNEIKDIIGKYSENEQKFQIGKIIENFENQKQNFSKNEFVKEISKKLGEGYSRTNLLDFAKFYAAFKDENKDVLNKIFVLFSWNEIKDIIKKKKNIYIEISEKEKGEDFLNIKIKTIELENIKQFDNLKLNLNGSLCLIGDNGIGKSSILRALALGLAFQKGFLNKEIFDVGYDFLKIHKVDKNGNIVYKGKGKIKIDYSIGDYNFTNEIILSFDEKNRNFSITGNENNPLANKSGYLKNLVLGFSQNRHNEGEEVVFNTKPHIVELKPLILNNDNDRIKGFTEWFLRSENDKDKQIILKNLKEVLNEVIDTDFDFIKVKRSDYNRNTIFVSTSESPEGVDFKLLSEGYKDLIGTIGYLIKRLAEAYPDKTDNLLNQPAICLFDEIDTFFHPKWQRKILNILIGKFKNVLFIVTTHSHLVAADCEPENRIILKQIGKKIVPLQGISPAGIDANTILINDFEMKSNYGKKALYAWDRFTELENLIKEETVEYNKKKLLKEYFDIANNYNFTKI